MGNKIIIAHRGNLFGSHESENSPTHINQALNYEFDVEVDVFIDETGTIRLGHDNPGAYEIPFDWLRQRREKLWIHCKNIRALDFFHAQSADFHYFWHEKDTVTITSRGFIWAHFGKQPIKNSIAVMPEIFSENIDKCIGICTDFSVSYRNA